jgi:hypothetical protein
MYNEAWVHFQLQFYMYVCTYVRTYTITAHTA